MKLFIMQPPAKNTHTYISIILYFLAIFPENYGNIHLTSWLYLITLVDMINSLSLTLYLKAGAIEWPLLAISAPVLRGVTFEGSKLNDNSFLYIYLKVLYPTGPKMIYKKFESCRIDQGVKLKYQKLNIIFKSEVIMSCK